MAATSHVRASTEEARRLRKEAGNWLRQLREQAQLSQHDLAKALGFKYYTFISQVENGFGRVPPESLKLWAQHLKQDPASFTKTLLRYYDPHTYEALFGDSP